MTLNTCGAVNLFAEIMLKNQWKFVVAKRDQPVADTRALQTHNDRPAIRCAPYGLGSLGFVAAMKRSVIEVGTQSKANFREQICRDTRGSRCCGGTTKHLRNRRLQPFAINRLRQQHVATSFFGQRGFCIAQMPSQHHDWTRVPLRS